MDAALSMRAAPAAPALPAAFEALFRREHPRVVAIAHRIVRDADEAEDVAQDVFVSFYRKHPADAGYASAWLHAAAAHTALNMIRSRDRRGRRESAHARETDRAIDPQRAVEDAETRAEVRSVLARMDERAASLLALRYSGLSYEEIAAALGLRRSSIGTLLSRAEDAFRKEVTR
ncbi:MAG TPA: sigma-70 family RNA polymerase sigma factor [Candidatus Limnocylindrales bacterium]|nr:sigma-70 family RNA polymerase sigma factor [Candidatus Limnocylindrales bacterium]